MNILLFDSAIKCFDSIELNNLIIILGPLQSIIELPYINIPQTIKSSCKKTYIQNNEITVICDNITFYKKYLISINSKFKLPIIYLKIDNYHLFITYYIELDCKVLFNLQNDLLYNLIEMNNIPRSDYIIIAGKFGYSFYKNPGEISSLCDKFSCNIPRITTDNKSILDKFIFIKKTNKFINNNICYKNNICKYNIQKKMK